MIRRMMHALFREIARLSPSSQYYGKGHGLHSRDFLILFWITLK
jgi:hypothetical protein